MFGWGNYILERTTDSTKSRRYRKLIREVLILGSIHQERFCGQRGSSTTDPVMVSRNFRCKVERVDHGNEVQPLKVTFNNNLKLPSTHWRVGNDVWTQYRKGNFEFPFSIQKGFFLFPPGFPESHTGSFLAVSCEEDRELLGAFAGGPLAEKEPFLWGVTAVLQEAVWQDSSKIVITSLIWP